MNNTSNKRFTSFEIKTIAFAAFILYNFAFSGLITNGIVKCILGTLGCCSLTLFAFLISEGVHYTSNLTFYLLRSLAVAIVAALPYRWVFAGSSSAYDLTTLNSAAFTSFFCIGSLVLYNRMKTKNLRVFCVLFLCVISFIFKLELAPYAVIITFIVHICKGKKFAEFAYYISSFSLVISLVSLFLLLTSDYNKNELYTNICLAGNLLALPIIKNYNSERGPRSRLLSYLTYPLTLVSILVLKYLANVL